MNSLKLVLPLGLASRRQRHRVLQGVRQDPGALLEEREGHPRALLSPGQQVQKQISQHCGL